MAREAPFSLAGDEPRRETDETKRTYLWEAGSRLLVAEALLLSRGCRCLLWSCEARRWGWDGCPSLSCIRPAQARSEQPGIQYTMPIAGRSGPGEKERQRERTNCLPPRATGLGVEGGMTAG